MGCAGRGVESGGVQDSWGGVRDSRVDLGVDSVRAVSQAQLYLSSATQKITREPGQVTEAYAICVCFHCPVDRNRGASARWRGGLQRALRELPQYHCAASTS